MLLFFVYLCDLWGALPGLDKAALSCDSRLRWQVDRCEQHIRNLTE